jgi:excinuclease ABC subunit C
VQVVRELPSEPGVYRFRDGGSEVLCVGRAAQLRSRVASYWSDLGDRRHLQPMVAAVASIEALVCGSRHEAAWLERNVLEGAALPPWNRTPGGQETLAVIVLDRRRPRPRLVVAHLPHEPIAGGSIFGPCLGGLQVRRAVAGLHRVYPLAYTGTRISGTERAMAVERSVTERDRDSLADALTAVLRRDPAAVAQAKAHL